MSEDLGPPEVEASEDTEQGAAEDHIVEVGDDVVGVGLLGVGWGHRVGDARQSADGEHGHHPRGKKHRRVEADPTTPHGG